MMMLECFKPSSFLGLPSMEGVARSLLKDRISKPGSGRGGSYLWLQVPYFLATTCREVLVSP